MNDDSLKGGGTTVRGSEEVSTDAGEAITPAQVESAKADRLFTQTDVDRIVKERLEREKSQREKAAQKAAAEAEVEALKKNQEWQALAQKNEERSKELESRLGELEPLSGQVERYSAALNKYLAAEKKELPRHVLVL